jgi:uncharacterized membrane protein
MLGDIGIIVFALIGIFAKKRWATVVATIWLITSFILNLTINFQSYSYYSLPQETFNGSLQILVIIEIALVVIGWCLIAYRKYKEK